ncbi:MAG: trypsin-like peptidase domain-containing protein [Planctomycetaceae bacterium]|nr:trypsin-like peptidase domain-containing protein [Planctomycetaceae bacterium]
MNLNIRRFLPVLSAGPLLILVLSASATADTIVLKSGQKIEGQVLKVQEDVIFVDIGIDVIKVPVDSIDKRMEDDAKEEATDTATKTSAGLLKMAKLPVKTVKDLVKRYAEGVVLIQNPGGLGSGFIVSEEGHCVTNYHVVEGQTRLAVTIFHRKENGEFERVAVRDVKILSLNPHFDLALLQIPKQDGIDFRPVFVAEDDSHREGDKVFAIGSPLGLERSVSEGIVSTRNRNMDGIVYIQTTAQINPGNSGGPLFNNKGEVVGVINMKLTLGEGLGFAIPVAYLRHFISNRDAFAFDRTNPNTGYHYLEPPGRTNPKQPYETEK